MIWTLLLIVLRVEVLLASAIICLTFFDQASLAVRSAAHLHSPAQPMEFAAGTWLAAAGMLLFQISSLWETFSAPERVLSSPPLGFIAGLALVAIGFCLKVRARLRVTGPYASLYVSLISLTGIITAALWWYLYHRNASGL